ncbi:MAG: hypothetical protein B6I20_07585 [Bacteroidetes bacterium 4572_117]|nr:MAG: hypothetical protein B6I20_07585 [Bacteroidetes bacterium 4572_117]
MVTKHIIAVMALIALSFFSCNMENSASNSDNKVVQKDISYVPEWSRNAIWYQIFVERFRNGDTLNDPKVIDIQGTYPDETAAGWKITSWGHDWYQPDDWFANSSLPDQWNNLQARRYGGDLQGVIDKLGYLQSLGVNAIYFNPLNDSPSLHKYDPRHWRHIDRNFGPDPMGDKKIIDAENPIDPKTWKWTSADKLFLKVIEVCHKRGMKVVLDYSFNHTGAEFWAFKDIQKNGGKSKVADWYEIESFDNPDTKENEFSYHGWAGVKYMPEMKKDIVGDRNEMPFEGNLHSQGAKNHIYSVAKRWLDPNKDGNPADGIDGYRLDVAAEVPMGFWVEFRKKVKKINPEAYIIGEIWWKSWPDELMFPHNFLQGDMFDAIMNYRWFRPARHFFADAPESMKPSEFVVALKDKLRDIDTARLQSMMNLLSSHDAPRISTSIYNNGKYKYQVKPYDNQEYKIDKPDGKTLEIQKMLLIHQFTFIGSPHIWYGDEVGMWGADDPDTRKPMVWQDIDYENETTHPFNKPRKTDVVEQDTILLSYYKKLIQIRKTYPTLAYGNIVFSLADDANNTFAYSRNYQGQEIVAAFNKSTDKKTLTIPIKKNGIFKNAMDEKQTFEAKNGMLSVELGQYKAIILVN